MRKRGLLGLRQHLLGLAVAAYAGQPHTVVRVSGRQVIPLTVQRCAHARWCSERTESWSEKAACCGAWQSPCVPICRGSYTEAGAEGWLWAKPLDVDASLCLGHKGESEAASARHCQPLLPLLL